VSGRPALLALEDGAVFRGTALGAESTAVGEVCFNTGMTGYQEILTDPSYRGQIVALTAPEIGVTGVNRADEQSRRPWAAGLAVRDPSSAPSSWRAEGSLHDYLEGHGIAGVAEIDTRRLTRHLRARGALRGALSAEILAADELVDRARAYDYGGRDLVAEVTTAEPYEWGLAELEARVRGGHAAGRAPLAYSNGRRRIAVAVLDFGIKANSLALLAAAGCELTVLPATTPAPRILDGGFDAVFLSNGPGNPEQVGYAVATTRRLLGRVPVFGICLGHQILALALGAVTYKLPFGHRGSNHPVRRLGCERIEITCQNHGFAVDAGSLRGTAGRLSHVNLNDHTVEGLEVEGAALAVQYHPEAGPGPHDSRYLFEEMRRLVACFEPHAAAAIAGGRAGGATARPSVRLQSVQPR
jgi:carbamoyl-phosphate synthase small subunit